MPASILLAVLLMGTAVSMCDAAKEAQVSLLVAIEVYQWLQEICFFRNKQYDDMHLGGNGPIHGVNIDESCFSHKPKLVNQF